MCVSSSCRVHTVIVQDTRFGLHLVKLGTQVSWSCRVLMGLKGGACQDFPSAQLDDPLLGFSQNFYLCKKLMIFTCVTAHARALPCRGRWRQVLVHGRFSPCAHPTVIADRSPLGQAVLVRVSLGQIYQRRRHRVGRCSYVP